MWRPIINLSIALLAVCGPIAPAVASEPATRFENGGEKVSVTRSQGKRQPQTQVMQVKTQAKIMRGAMVKRPKSVTQLRHRFQHSGVTITTIRREKDGVIVHYVDFS